MTRRKRPQAIASPADGSNSSPRSVGLMRLLDLWPWLHDNAWSLNTRWKPKLSGQDCIQSNAYSHHAIERNRFQTPKMLNLTRDAVKRWETDLCCVSERHCAEKYGKVLQVSVTFSNILLSYRYENFTTPINCPLFPFICLMGTGLEATQAKLQAVDQCMLRGFQDLWGLGPAKQVEKCHSWHFHLHASKSVKNCEESNQQHLIISPFTLLIHGSQQAEWEYQVPLIYKMSLSCKNE